MRSLPQQDVLALAYDWEFQARPEQLEPEGQWLVWLIITGRGWGKTLTGAQTVRRYVERGRAQQVALVGATAADVRDTMIGLSPDTSGLLQVCPPWNRPEWEPSKRRVIWPGGQTATAFSSEEPDRLRGPQHDLAWADELAAWEHLEATYDMMMFGLRRGEAKLIITSTPQPKPLVKSLVKDSKTPETTGVVLTVGSMYDNPYLTPAAVQRLKRRYEGTRLGEQELHGKILDDNPNALWTIGVISDLRMEPMDFARKVAEGEIVLRRSAVAVDPAVTGTKKSDETGIVAGYLDDQNPPHAYIIEDASVPGVRPEVWAAVATKTYQKRQADRLVGEVNNGGDLVENVIRQADRNVNFRAVRASRGKILRAEPVSALYEQGRVHHVGRFEKLEDQMCEYDGTGDKSPDRLDALVWLLTDLIIDEENGAEVAIQAAERHIARCAAGQGALESDGREGCGAITYVPSGQTTVMCRQCGRVLRTAYREVTHATAADVVEEELVEA